MSSESSVSVESYQLSVISYQLSVVSYQLSVVSCQLSVVSCQLSVVSCQLPVVSCWLSVVSYQLKAKAIQVNNYPSKSIIGGKSGTGSMDEVCLLCVLVLRGRSMSVLKPFQFQKTMQFV